MRSFPSVLVAMVLFAGAFAGCLGDEGDEPAPPTADATGASLPALNDTANATVDDGTTEMSADLGHQPHIHDYWKGKERVTIMDEDVQVDAPNAIGWTFGNTFFGTPGVGGAFVQLPDESIVFEGTGKLEFTATWTDPTITGVGLRYRSAASPQFSQPADIATGAAHVIEVTPEMSDMPHEKTSRWAFILAPSQAGQVVVGKIHVKIDIVRMKDITLFPGHPELFGDEHTLTLFDGPGTSSQQNFASMIANFVTKQPGTDDAAKPDKIVPMETMTMTANLTIKAVSADVGKVSDVGFLVKPANRNGYHYLQPVSMDEATQTYQFAWQVEMKQTDSPYAKESMWRFDVWVSTDPSGGAMQGSCGGCSNAQVEYDLVVVAYDGLVEGADQLPDGGRG